MGKHDSGYELMSRDLYCTPAWVTNSLIERVVFRGCAVDPACGERDIVKVFNDRSSTFMTGVDISEGYDFLADNNSYYQSIVTNPPYGRGKLAMKFIDHALSLTHHCCGQVAMLLPVDFDSGKTRRYLFDQHKAFQQKIVLTERIRWANLEQKKNGPKENHAWYIWDWSNTQTPVMRYAP